MPAGQLTPHPPTRVCACACARRVCVFQVVGHMDTDGQGYLTAGTTLKWIDLCALSVAWRHCQESAVTKCIDSIVFHVAGGVQWGLRWCQLGGVRVARDGVVICEDL